MSNQRRIHDAFYEPGTTRYQREASRASSISSSFSSRNSSAPHAYGDLGSVRRPIYDGELGSTRRTNYEASPGRSTFAQAVMRDQDILMARMDRSQGLSGFRPPRASSFDYRSGRRQFEPQDEDASVSVYGGGRNLGNENDFNGYNRSNHSYDADIPSLVISESSSDGTADDAFACDAYVYKPPVNEMFYEDRKMSAQYDEDRKPSARPSVTAVRGPPRDKTDKKTSMIQVAPGLSARLRGAAETWEAIKSDFYRPCMCLACNTDLFCIQDAWLVLCPDCRVLSPMEDLDGETRDLREGGVGLGFKGDALAEWQASLYREFC
jgi:hypothetical protein